MKKQSLFLRMLMLALALAMLVSTFAACATEEDDDGDGTATSEEAGGTGNGSNTVEDIEVETDENGYPVDNLPGDLKFDTTVRILGVQEYTHQFYMKEEDIGDDLVAKSIYDRNMTVEDRLGIELKWDFAKGEWGSRNTFLQAVSAACEADPYDAMICYNLVPYMLAQQGLCADLYTEESYIDFSAPWWPQSQVEQLLVNDTMYAVTESNDKGLLANMMAMFFNNTLLEARGLESPYDLVKSNEWTVEKFSTMIKDTYEDKNGDGKADSGDVYGFINATTSKSDSWFYALGYRLSEKVGDEVVSYVNDSKIQEYVDRMVTFYDSKDIMLADTKDYGGIGQGQLFYNENAYFYNGATYMGQPCNDANINFGVVPMPKLNSQQERYYTHLSNTYDTWCVSFNADDMELSSAVLECMASESFRQIGPMYYDTNIKLRYAPDERLSEMYDLVRDSVTFDLIYLYTCAYADANNAPKEIVKWCTLKSGTYNWSSKLATYKTTWDEGFDAILATYVK